MASGLRINSAKDDASGLLVSNRLTSQINGLDQGNRNANDGIALAQTVDGALAETVNMLQRIRTLAVQSANGTYTQEDRDAIQQEVNQLCYEVNRIAEKTTFAGARILDGVESTQKNNNAQNPNTSNLLDDNGAISFQVGSNHDDTLSLNLSSGFSLYGIALALGENKKIGYNGKNLKVGLISSITTPVFHTGKSAIKARWFLRWSVSAQSSSQLTLGNIDKYIEFVDSKRAELGAIQNRMEATIRNQANISENESDARSRISDTDFAKETADLTQNNIIQQASQTVLTQANQRPTIATYLLN